MKNALLFKLNSFFAYMTVNVVFGFIVAEFILSLQTKVNEYFDYDWADAVDQFNSL
jgi:hypothetical protein